MKTMPRYKMKIMRFLVERILTSVQHWEDKLANPADYRMKQLNAGLWQSSQSLRELIEGRFESYRKVTPVMRLPQGDTPSEKYMGELFGNVTIPLRPSDN